MLRALTRTRPGRHRRVSDVAAKSRAFSAGAAQFRLRLALWPPTIVDVVASWVKAQSPATLIPDSTADEPRPQHPELHDPVPLLPGA